LGSKDLRHSPRSLQVRRACLIQLVLLVTTMF
jgi:hypothetical protein